MPTCAQSECFAPTYQRLAGIVADQERAEAGPVPGGGEGRDAVGELGADRRSGRLAVEDRRGHVGQSAREVTRPAAPP